MIAENAESTELAITFTTHPTDLDNSVIIREGELHTWNIM